MKKVKILKSSKILKKSEAFWEGVIFLKTVDLLARGAVLALRCGCPGLASAAPRLSGVFFKGVGIWSERSFFQSSVIAKIIASPARGDILNILGPALVFLGH
jgi:hypothetical protein